MGEVYRADDLTLDPLPLSALLLASPLNYLGGSGPWALLFPITAGVLITVLTVRHGLLALLTARIVWNLIYAVPMMPAANHWSATPGNSTIALLRADAFCVLRVESWAAVVGVVAKGRPRVMVAIKVPPSGLMIS